MRSTRTALHYEPINLALAARARFGLGDVAGALDAALQGVALARERELPVQEARAHLELARILAADEPRRARAELELTAELSRGECPALEPHIHMARAEVAALHGDDEGRLRELRAARELFEQQGARGHLRRVAEELATASA